MLNKKNLLAISLSLLLWGCGNLKTYNEVFEERGHVPTILDSYAPDVIRPGDTWRIYLHARDVDGDMKHFISALWQSGFGYYATDFTVIDGKDSKEVSGYLYLKTPRDDSIFGDNFSLKVIVRDRRGNKSEPVEFLLRFGNVPAQEMPAKWEKVADRDLGPIMVNIRSPQERDGG
ncbi:MAG: hypothetical protein PVF76_01430 [Syntrophobacterales bacterium]